MAHENAKNVINAYKLTSTKLLQLKDFHQKRHQHILIILFHKCHCFGLAYILHDAL